MRPSLLVVVPPLLALASCASAPPQELPPLTRLAQHELASSATLSREGIPDFDDPMPAEPPEPVATGAIQMRARMAALDPEAARRLVGWRAGDGAAWSTRLDEVERVLAACAGEEGAALRDPSTVMLVPDEPLTVRLLDQQAYVKSFEFELSEGVLTADPVVGVFTEGATIRAMARPAAESGRTALELDLELVHLCRPIPVYETRPLGGRTPLSIQQPVASAQHLRTAVELAPEECLVLVRPALDGTDRFLFVFVAARPTPGGTPDSAG